MVTQTESDMFRTFADCFHAPGIHDPSCRAVWRPSRRSRRLHGRHRALRRVALTLAEDYGVGERNGGTGGGTIDQAQVGIGLRSDV